MLELKNSILVSQQVPEYVRAEYPLFVNFLEAYYEYLETKQGSQKNDLIAQAKNLRYILVIILLKIYFPLFSFLLLKF